MRPHPPEAMFERLYGELGRFVPAPEIIGWAQTTFIDDDASLPNEDHAHLRQAKLAALWTTIPNGRQGRTIIGQAEPGDPAVMGKWRKARAEQQIVEWFGDIPDFILTFDAKYASQCSDAEFMALVEHELMHCGQERDEWGAPKFRKSGLPAFCMRAHDVEEFVGVVRRYGATSQALRDMVDAVNKGPDLGISEIASACGTCQLRAA
jgi:hypothetical protein